MQQKSLEERLYQSYYSRLEAHCNNPELPRSFAKLANTMKYVCGVGALILGTYFAYDIVANTSSLEKLIFRSQEYCGV